LSTLRAVSILATHEGQVSSWLRNRVFFMVDLLFRFGWFDVLNIPVCWIPFHDLDQLSAYRFVWIASLVRPFRFKTTQ
jgi:hypothetical protein